MLYYLVRDCRGEKNARQVREKCVNESSCYRV